MKKAIVVVLLVIAALHFNKASTAASNAVQKINIQNSAAMAELNATGTRVQF